MISSGMYCFGYGSLVNRNTHVFEHCEKSTLRNWKRRWSHRTNGQRSVTSLTIEPRPGAEIYGLIAWVSEDQVPLLDQRESGYSKTSIEPEVSKRDDTISRSTITYVSNTPQDGNTENPILQSYLDAVLKGFLREFGEAGVRHFMQSTEGWNAPVLQDRHDPIYPRSVEVSRDEEDLFDSEAKRLGVNWIK